MIQEMQAIAHIRSDFPQKFGIPRQSGIVPETTARIIFEPEFRQEEAFRGLEGFSRLWLIWVFSANRHAAWQPTVRPPRLGGNTRMGVFATRSPYRPNPIGLSCVELDHLEHTAEGPVLVVRGADLMDGTPILDIKPYLPYADAFPDAAIGFTKDTHRPRLVIDFPEKLLKVIPEEKRAALNGILGEDPRPSYQEDGRAYGVSFAGKNIRFYVEGNVLHVTAVEELEALEK